MFARSGTQMRVDYDAAYSPDKTSAEVVSIIDCYRDLDQQAADQFSKLCAENRWKDAINLVVSVVRISEAELASGLAVSRSTVNRWLTAGSRPLQSAMPDIEAVIVSLILARHGQQAAT